MFKATTQIKGQRKDAIVAADRMTFDWGFKEGVRD